MDELVEKLRLLKYLRDFCKPLSFKPLSKNYFSVQQANPNEQLYYFSSLFAWLAKLSGNKFDAPGQFDDPNTTASNIAALVKELSPDFEYTASKLRLGYGDGVIAALSLMADRALKSIGFRVQPPVHSSDEVIEEAEADDTAEVMLNAIEEDLPEEQEDDLPFGDRGRQSPSATAGASSTADSTTATKAVNPAEWRQEVERAVPNLKVIVPNDNKDWRIHLQQMTDNEESIGSNLTVVKTQLSKIGSEIDQTLEKIASREKYINSQFEPLVDEFRASQEALSQLKLKYNASSEVINKLTDELSRVSDELDSVKTQMDDIGNGMTDSKPLVNIRQAIQRLKAEIKQMDIRLGVVEHSLLMARLRNKGNMVTGASDLPVLGGLQAFMT
ncbi:hypothetical protein RI367_004197 [Sorochytrium milnesiophthora]